MLDSLTKGTRVVTIGGIHGKVVSTKENEVTIRVDANAQITFDRNAISKVLDANAVSDSAVENDSKKK
jgi:preprotein translocase subunit YajC